ncbi:multicopper oxidase family protein [Synechococcus sp. NOUM97013]|uniref:multicopper oxidase family protein n=1 Tax=Synechococcus sp. NOUM97013 TaxID=1442555 RepID=UPI001648D1AA|nr:multicopper oxidase domain-containing protein [Synechococcus sp. NOUM97013]QNI72770.1 cupredoxin-like protein [Synechococcus sp. NOUM97013]
MSQFRIGSLYPVDRDGIPNVFLSSGYSLGQDSNGFYISENGSSNGSLKAQLEITTDPVDIKNVSAFITDWLVPQLTNKDDESSIFNQYLKSITSTPPSGGWGVYPNNELLEALSYIGYRGYGYDQAANQTGFWAETSTPSGLLYQEVLKKDNYFPEELWSNDKKIDTILSDFDSNALLKNLAVMSGASEEIPPLWYPSMLYTYGLKGKGTSYPGPVLMIKPGETLELEFDNNISIAGLTGMQAQMASLVENNSYGLNGGSMAGAMDSTNFHMHGGHVTPTGFGDNVVSRYTTGQDWTTIIDIPEDHGRGSYWYHPHFHPAVNTQVYGGLSGFMQVGDPLSLIPAFKDVPRNLGVIKTMQVGIDQTSGDYQLAAVNGNILGTEGLAANRASMFTINGEYQPEVDIKSGGWQSFSFSNQDNNYYMNIAMRHQKADGSWVELPLYIYGEDGHTYPQIRKASQGVLGYQQAENAINATSYKQASNLISLPSGKRLDLLVYLPAGKSELISAYGFEDANGQEFGVNNLRWQPDKYAELSTENTDFSDPNSGPGAIASFNVSSDSPDLNTQVLDNYIEQANQQINVQEISPQTTSEDYSSDAIPSVNLFEKDWNPTRQRQFNWQILQLVGPEDQWDIPTQKEVAKRAGTDFAVTKHELIPTSLDNPWLGYINPDLINDHVFPQGPLVIAQLGTMEEWSLRNWNWGGKSVANGGFFTSHPFHIHVNDYQVKQSDNELPDKRNLEDVTQLNSSGYNYVDSAGVNYKLDPLVGEFVAIDEALNPNSSDDLYTTGYNETTIRMLYQDFLGTYVHHCHLLEHEDAGMMQVVSVIENTDSSWIIPAESFGLNQKGLVLREADSLEQVTLDLQPELSNTLQRTQVGDITNDFVQDIILSFGGFNGSSGQVRIYDGSSLKKNQEAVLLSSFRPYEDSTLSPWAFNSDFTGDGKRDLITAGFVKSPDKDNQVKLPDLELIGWQAKETNYDWSNLYSYRPWENVADASSILLSSDSTAVGVGDYNLDNFDDYAFAYVDQGVLRIRILDGASVSLLNQTGQFEGGYLPDTDILTDIEYSPASTCCFDDLKSLSITSGFNSYSQSAIENLIVTAESKSGHSEVLTFQLNSGHFIATGSTQSDESKMDGHSEMNGHSDMAGGQAHSEHDHSSHQGHIMSTASLEGVNQVGGAFMLSLTNHQLIEPGLSSATPTFAGALANGALVIDDRLVLSQGASDGDYFIGNPSSSNDMANSTQDLYLNLEGINRVNIDDLTGITQPIQENPLYGSVIFDNAVDADQRVNLTLLAYQAYTNTMIKPSDLATLSVGNERSELSSRDLVDRILNDYSVQVESYYGESFDEMSIDSIARKAFNTLYDRNPSSAELSTLNSAVKNGLSKTDLPMAILRSTNGFDTYRVALLSAASKWSQAQWGTNSVIDGDFGQGFVARASNFDNLSNLLLGSGLVSGWAEANSLFEQYRDDVLTSLSGSPISDTGFF